MKVLFDVFRARGGLRSRFTEMRAEPLRLKLRPARGLRAQHRRRHGHRRHDDTVACGREQQQLWRGRDKLTHVEGRFTNVVVRAELVQV